VSGKLNLSDLRKILEKELRTSAPPWIDEYVGLRNRGLDPREAVTRLDSEILR